MAAPNNETITARILSGEGMWNIERCRAPPTGFQLLAPKKVLCIPLNTSEHLDKGVNSRVFDQFVTTRPTSISFNIGVQLILEVMREYTAACVINGSSEASLQPFRFFLECVQAEEQDDDEEDDGGDDEDEEANNNSDDEDDDEAGSNDIDFVNASDTTIVHHRIWIFIMNESTTNFGTVLSKIMKRSVFEANDSAKRRNDHMLRSSRFRNASESIWYADDQQWKQCQSLEFWAMLCDELFGYTIYNNPATIKQWIYENADRLSDEDFLLNPKQVFAPTTHFNNPLKLDRCRLTANARQLNIKEYWDSEETTWKFPLQRNVLEIPVSKLAPGRFMRSFLPAQQMNSMTLIHHLAPRYRALQDIDMLMQRKRKVRRWQLGDGAVDAHSSSFLNGGGSSNSDASTGEVDSDGMHDDDILIDMDALDADVRRMINVDEPSASDDQTRDMMLKIADTLQAGSAFLNMNTSHIVHTNQMSDFIRVNRDAILSRSRELVHIFMHPIERLATIYSILEARVYKERDEERRGAKLYRLQKYMLRQYEREAFSEDCGLGPFHQAILHWIHQNPLNLFEFHKVRKEVRLFDTNMSIFANCMAQLLEIMEHYFVVSTQHPHVFRLFFGSLSAYIEQNTMLFHSLTVGEGGVSKSYALDLLTTRLLIPGSSETFSDMTTKAFQTTEDRSSHITIQHEMQAGRFAADKRNNSDETEDGAIWKEMLTSNYVRSTWCGFDDTGKKVMHKVMLKAPGCFHFSANKIGPLSDAHKSRMNVTFIRGGGRTEKGITKVKQCDSFLATQDQVGIAYVSRLFQRRQALHYLVEKLIGVGALPKFGFFVLPHVMSRLEDFCRRKNYTAPVLRTDERIRLLVRSLSIQRVLFMVFDVPGCRFFNQRFELKQLFALRNLLHDSEEPVFFALGLMNESYANPIINVVKLIMLEHILETHRANPRPNMNGNIHYPYRKRDLMSRSARMRGTGLRGSQFAPQAMYSEMNNDDRAYGHAPDEIIENSCNIIARAQECEIGESSSQVVSSYPGVLIDYSWGVIQQPTVRGLVKWLQGKWPEYVAKPSGGQIYDTIMTMFDMTIKSCPYSEPLSPGERPIPQSDQAPNEHKVLESGRNTEGQMKGCFHISMAYLADVDLDCPSTWVEDHDPIKEFIAEEMQHSYTVNQKLIYGRTHRGHPNLFETIQTTRKNTRIVCENVLRVTQKAQSMLFVNDPSVSLDHRLQPGMVLRTDIDTYATRMHLKSIHQPYDDESVRMSDIRTLEARIGERWAAKNPSAVNFDYPKGYIAEYKDTQERIRLLLERNKLNFSMDEEDEEDDSDMRLNVPLPPRTERAKKRSRQLYQSVFLLDD